METGTRIGARAAARPDCTRRPQGPALTPTLIATRSPALICGSNGRDARPVSPIVIPPLFAYISSLSIMPSRHERRRRKLAILDLAKIYRPGMIDGKQDLGRILETMLYYDRARLLVSA